MCRRPLCFTRSDTLFPYRTLFRATAGLANRLEDSGRCGIAGGSANALTLIPPVPIAVRAAGRVYFVTPSSTNTGPTTAKPSELPAAAIQLAEIGRAHV